MKKLCVALLSIVFIAACNNNEPVKFEREIDSSKPNIDSSIYKRDTLLDAINAQDTAFNDGGNPTAWWEAGFNNPAVFKIFVDDLRTWVKKEMVDSIAAHIKYPLKNAKTAIEFKANYNNLFNEKVKHKVITQRLDRIFRNAKGAMIGDGELWINQIKDGYFITAINN